MRARIFEPVMENWQTAGIGRVGSRGCTGPLDMKSTGADVRMQWGVRIPLRDGIHLNAILYLPPEPLEPRPVIFTLTPYVAQTSHDRGLYFASHGYPFLCVDVRGRGDSEGEFEPLINEARDGFDITEWLATQPYCNGKVAMWGGSYSGYTQWATAREHPPHLATIVPAAAPFIGADFPGRSNLPTPYLMQWLTLVWGRTSQDKLFWKNELYWGERFRQWFESGAAFRDLDRQLGSPSPVFQRWLEHPFQDAYWDRYNPTAQQYANMSLPVLTITGCYDGDQPGALAHYAEHLKHCPVEIRSRHYLVIGPWDHAGTRTPATQFGGLEVGAASMVDLPALHLQWYAWTLQGGPKPEFLRKNVAYYLMVADQWRYADTLEEVTRQHEPLYLSSTVNPTDVFHSGTLGAAPATNSGPDHYVHDPRDLGRASLESTVDPQSRVDQRMLFASVGKLLVYHSAPFERDTEVSGFFKLSAWLSIDQPDTDFRAWVYDVAIDGGATQLCFDSIRARYRLGLREPVLVNTDQPLRYDFERFMFVSRLIRKGHRLRLVIGPLHSIYNQKNYNTGGDIASQTVADARPVTVRLFHDPSHPSVLQVPIGS